MDGQILANSLVSLRGMDLRMVYALLFKTNIGNLLSAKTKDFFTSEERDHFTDHLAEEVRKLENQDDAVLQVDLFLELTKLLKLKGTKYTLTKEIEEQCSNIVHGVYAQFQKQDKQFRNFSERQTRTSSLQQMVNFQMNKIFDEFDQNFEDFTIEDQTRFAAQVNAYINNLPQEKQQKIKEKLGIDDLTDEVIRKAITTSGTSLVFAIIVEVSGFAFYTTATSLVASFAGLFGLTLPFGFYTGLTSFIAVLANPLFILPLLLGGGIFLFNQQNKSFKKKLLPIILMQIALPYMSGGSEFVQLDSFIGEWERRYDDFAVKLIELNRIEAEQADIRSHIDQMRKEIHELTHKININAISIKTEKQAINTTLKSEHLDQLEINDSFKEHTRSLKEIEAKIALLKKMKKGPEKSSGLFKRIGNSLSNFSTSLSISEEERKAEQMMDQLVEDIIVSDSLYQKGAREKIHQLKLKKEELGQIKTTCQEELRMLIQEQNMLNDKVNGLDEKLSSIKKANYGFADLSAEVPVPLA